MKKQLLIIASLFSVNSFAQTNAEIPNHEFNNWDSDTNPSAWSTLEDAVGGGAGIVEKEQADIRNGAASLKLVTPQPSGYVNYSIVALGNLEYNTTIHRLVSSGAGYNSRPDSVWILYKYNSPASDSAGISVTLKANNGGNAETVLNVLYPIPENAEWVLKSYKLHTKYVSNATPDSIYVSLFSSASQVRTPNSVLQVDGVYFNNPSNTTAVKDLSAQTSLKLYPNPLVHGSVLKIASTEALTGGVLHLIDVNGKEIGRYNINRQNTIQPETLLSGNYFWYITDGHNDLVGKGQLSVL